MGLLNKFRKKPEMDPIIEIARIVSQGDSAVLSQAALCSADIKKYFSENTIGYEERGIDDTTDERTLKWIGLVDILINASCLCERDWKDEKSDFIFFLQNLNTTKALNLKIDEHQLDDSDDIPRWCETLDTLWKQQGACVAAFDIDSDSYVIFPCKVSDLPKLQQHAALSGYRIDLAKNM